MMVKIVTLFLIGMAVLAMFGRYWLPGKGLRKIGRRPKAGDRLAAFRCPACGEVRAGAGPCPCGRG